jgi:PAS domain S-box-containing protein
MKIDAKLSQSLRTVSEAAKSVLTLLRYPAFIICEDGTLGATNSDWCDMFGPFETAKNIMVSDLFSDRTGKILLAFLQNQDSQKGTLKLKDTCLLCPTGNKYIASIRAICIENELLVSLKIHHKKQGSDYFKDFSIGSLHNMILEAIPAPVFCKNTDHIYTACNDEFLEYIGQKRENVIGKSIEEVSKSKEANVYRAADDKLFEEGGKQVYETAVKHSDGTAKTVIFHKSVLRDATNSVVGLIGIILDISRRQEAEQKAQYSQTMLQAIVDNSPAYIFVKDLQGRYLLTSDKITRDHNWPKGHMIGKTDHELFPEKIAKRFIETDQQMLTKKGAVTLRDYQDIQGNLKYHLTDKFPLYDNDGNIDRIAIIANDITELVEAENKLKEASQELEQTVISRTKELSEEISYRRRTENDLREMLASSPVAVGISSIEQGALSFANDSLCNLLGFTQDELINNTTLQFWKSIEQRDKLVDELKHYGKTEPIEVEILTKEKKTLWVLLSWNKLHIDGEDKIVSWLSNIEQLKSAEKTLKKSHSELESRVTLRTAELEREIVERKNIEQALRKREEQFEAYATSSSDWFWGMDENLHFDMLSERFSEITGLLPEKILGKKRWEATDEFYRDASWTTHMDDLNRHRPFRDFRMTMTREDGSILHAVTSGVPIFDDHGSFKGYRGTGRDVTKEVETQKAAEKMENQLHQAQKMEAIGQLTGGIAHDFNNILAIILGNTELMQEILSESHKLQSYLSAVERSATRGAQLTQRLLAYSRKQELRPSTIGMFQLIEGIVDLVDRLLGETIEISYAFDPNTAPVFADSGQLENAFVNLCINARDAMPNGGALSIKTGNRYVSKADALYYDGLEPGHYSYLCVTDTGNGMDAETLEHVFEPFFTTKEVGKGTGLGLSMIYGFAKQSGGTVNLQSELGKGTKAQILLPSATEQPTE